MKVFIAIICILLAVESFLSPFYFAIAYSPIYFLLFFVSWIPCAFFLIIGKVIAD